MDIFSRATAWNELKQEAVFCGQNNDGRYRVKIGGKKALVAAILCKQLRMSDTTGRKRSAWLKVGCTPGYETGAIGEVVVIARCAVRKELYRLIGKVSHCVARSVEPKVAEVVGAIPEPVLSVRYQVSAKVTDVTVPPVSILPVEGQFGGIAAMCVPRRKQRQFAEFKRDLEVIEAQRNAGFDPDVRLSFVVGYVHESRANLYRKMGASFPNPVKRGRSIFWAMSQIEAYKSGKYQGRSVERKD